MKGPSDAPQESQAGERFRIIEIELDESIAGRQSPDLEHERKVAIFDLIEENHFRPEGDAGGPYYVHLSITSNRLVFDVRVEQAEPYGQIQLSLSPLRKIIKDYFLVCDSYYEAIKTASPSQIEAIDVGRRGLHNEGSEVLQERLKGKIDIDFSTARRLFTLICALHHQRG